MFNSSLVGIPMVCWIIVAMLITCSHTQSIPVMQPVNAVLGANTAYEFSYYSTKSLSASASFTLDFSNTQIKLASTTSSACDATVAGVNVASPSCTFNATANKVTLKLNSAYQANNKVVIRFGTLINPSYTTAQNVGVSIYFGPTVTLETLTASVAASIYQLMSLTINSFTQSDYGVGSTGITYSWNMTLPFAPKNPQLQVTIPTEVGLANINLSIIYYGTVQNVAFLQAQSIIVFNLVSNAISDPINGWMSLTITGFTNPQFIGQSSSFVLTLYEVLAQPGCGTCRIASNVAPVYAVSTTPGDIQTSIESSVMTVGQLTRLSINNRLFAPIPIGGSYLIRLPDGVTPSLPVSCANVFGFTLTTTDGKPNCLYNQVTNTIQTVNFAYQNLVSAGSAIISVDVFNPIDSRTVGFTFMTKDAAQRIIGKTKGSFQYSAIPMTLTATITKNNTEIDAVTSVTASVRLQMSLGAQDKITMYLTASELQTLTTIQCRSGSLILACTKSIDTVAQLITISVPPPCVVCSAGATLSFTIDGIINPAFIRDDTQQIDLATTTQYGSMETVSKVVALTVSQLQISNYARVGASQIGGPLSITFDVSVPRYLRTYGGSLIVLFEQKDVYVNPTADGTYPLSLSITSGANVMQNTVSYNSQTGIKSIKSVIISVCGLFFCPNTIAIISIRQAITAAGPILLHKIKAVTLASNDVSQTSISGLSRPARYTDTIGLSIPNNFAAQLSQYTITFKTPQIPFQSGLTIALSTMHSINETCFVVANVSLGFAINCAVTSTNSVQLTYTGDPFSMLLSHITFTVTLRSVLNPSSVMPFLYKLQSTFGGFVNALYSVTAAIAKPFPFSVTLKRSNNTYGQLSTITLTFANGFPSFNSLSLTCQKSLLTILPSDLTMMSTGADNNTHFQLNGISSLSAGNTLSLAVRNPNSTVMDGYITVYSTINGYLSSSATIYVPSLQPMSLAPTFSIATRKVGSLTSLTFQLSNLSLSNIQTSFKVVIPANLFSSNPATFNNQPLTMTDFQYTLIVPISNTNILVDSLKNLLYIPSILTQFGQITVSTIKSGGEVVAMSTIPASLIVPNAFATPILFQCRRSSTNSNDATSLTISFTPRFTWTGCTIKIDLPSGQNVFNASPGCRENSETGVACSYVSSTSSSIVVTYSGFSSLVLTGVTNIYPNANPITLSTFNSFGDLIEVGTYDIQPKIALNRIDITCLSRPSPMVTSNSLMSIRFSLPRLQANSVLKVTVPTGYFTRWVKLNTADCTWDQGNRCQFITDTNGWLTSIGLGTVGTTDITAGTIMTLTITLTNGWSALPFTDSSLVLTAITSNNIVTSSGTLPLTTIFNGALSFTQPQIVVDPATQSNLQASASNNIIIAFSIPVPVRDGSIMTITLSAAYSDRTVIKTIACNTNDICYNANSKITLTLPVTNAATVPINAESLQLALKYNGYSIIPIATLPLQSLIPFNFRSLNVVRSSNLAGQASTVTVTYSVTGTLPSDAFVVINPISFDLPLLQILTVGQRLAANRIGLPIAVSPITFNGINPSLVPKSPQQYFITIETATVVLFKNIYVPTVGMLPLSQGVTIVRKNNIVSQLTTHSVSISLPMPLTGYNLQIPSLNINMPIIQSTIQLPTIVNPSTSTDPQNWWKVIISNGNYIAYSNDAIMLTPPLLPKALDGIVSFDIPIMRINSQAQIRIVFKTSTTNITVLKINLPNFYTKIVSLLADNKTHIYTELVVENGKTISLVPSFGFTTVIVRVNTNPYRFYQLLATVSVYIQAPAAMATFRRDVRVEGIPLALSVKSSSLKIRTVSDYLIQVSSIDRKGLLKLSPPEWIQSKIADKSVTVLKDGASYSLVSPFSIDKPINITLHFNGVVNPPDNRPLIWTAKQYEPNNQSLIFGYSELSMQMQQLDFIQVRSASRSSAKLGQPIIIDLNITTPVAYQDTMIIQFPSNQVLASLSSNGGSKCTILIDKLISQPCQFISQSSVKTMSVKGMHLYTITGLSNQAYIVSPNPQDRVKVTIGTPFNVATTSSTNTVYLLPYMLVGKLQLLNLTSINNNCLAANTLTFTLKMENWQIVNAIQFVFGRYHIIVPNNGLKVVINGNVVGHNRLNSSAIEIGLNKPSPIVTVRLQNVINYAKKGLIVIKTVKLINPIVDSSSKLSATPAPTIPTAADLDMLIYQDQTTLQLKSTQLQARIVLPNPYIASEQKKIIFLIDNTLNSAIPFNELEASLTFQNQLCSLNKITFAKKLQFSCKLTNAGLSMTSLSVSHTKISSPLLVFTSPIDVLNLLHQQCSDSLCDICANSLTKGEQCISCRQGGPVNDGKCVDQCINNTFAYGNTKICTQCSPTCSNCYGLQETQCLGCSSQLLVLQDGSCLSQCLNPNTKIQIGSSSNSSRSKYAVCASSSTDCSLLGCRTCSSNGFCYQCLPDFSGSPKCQSTYDFPPLLFSYIQLPFLLIPIIALIVSLKNKHSIYSILSTMVFALTIPQTLSWVFLSPAATNKAITIILLSIFACRIVLGIVSYQSYYKLMIPALCQPLLDSDTQTRVEQKQSVDRSQDRGKEKESDSSNQGGYMSNGGASVDRLWTIMRWCGQIFGPEIYYLIQSSFIRAVKEQSAEGTGATTDQSTASPQYMPQPLALVILTIIVRLIGMLVLGIQLSLSAKSVTSDRIILPIIGIVSGVIIMMMRGAMTDKFRKCWTKVM